MAEEVVAPAEEVEEEKTEEVDISTLVAVAEKMRPSRKRAQVGPPNILLVKVAKQSSYILKKNLQKCCLISNLQTSQVGRVSQSATRAKRQRRVR